MHSFCSRASPVQCIRLAALPVPVSAFVLQPCQSRSLHCSFSPASPCCESAAVWRMSVVPRCPCCAHLCARLQPQHNFFLIGAVAAVWRMSVLPRCPCCAHLCAKLQPRHYFFRIGAATAVLRMSAHSSFSPASPAQCIRLAALRLPHNAFVGQPCESRSMHSRCSTANPAQCIVHSTTRITLKTLVLQACESRSVHC